MFAIDHAATALIIKRRYPSAPLPLLLVAVQAMELAWVVLNVLGVERTTTEPVVRSVADIHLVSIPYSHSVATALGAALLAWLVLELGVHRPALGRAIGLGIASHLVLDVITHARDLALWPGAAAPHIGLGLYDGAPLAAWVLEMAYGLFCWRIYRGSRTLLAVIVIANLANLSLLSVAIPGPEAVLGGRPLLIVGVIAVQIVVTLVLVGYFARDGAVTRREAGARGARRDDRRGGRESFVGAEPGKRVPRIFAETARKERG